MFDTNGLNICIPISGVPGCILIPYKLANGSICFNLIMSRSFTSLPNIVAAFSGQITAIVMNNNITNWISGTSRSEMSIDDLDLSASRVSQDFMINLSIYFELFVAHSIFDSERKFQNLTSF